MLSRLLALWIAIAGSVAGAADFCQAPDEIGIFRADDPVLDRVDVTWGTETFRRYFKGRVLDGNENGRKMHEWVLSIMEARCRSTTSSRIQTTD
jgi:hypothetical protein